MTWYAVPNDVVGGWCVADQQRPLSELLCDRPGRALADVMVYEDARFVAGALNYVDAAFKLHGPASALEGVAKEPMLRVMLQQYSSPWPEVDQRS